MVTWSLFLMAYFKHLQFPGAANGEDLIICKTSRTSETDNFTSRSALPKNSGTTKSTQSTISTNTEKKQLYSTQFKSTKISKDTQIFNLNHLQTTPSIANNSNVSDKSLNEEQNNTLYKCFCCKLLSGPEQTEKVKELKKELVVNRRETSRYLRSKTSAKDDRVSSQVIGSVGLILMAIPFGLVVITDLISLLNLIYIKIK